MVVAVFRRQWCCDGVVVVFGCFFGGGSVAVVFWYWRRCYCYWQRCFRGGPFDGGDSVVAVVVVVYVP